jgi:protein-tyrosine phosphatase
MIRIEGTTNVRDIGGLMTLDGRKVRQGMYYRSAEFNQNHVITPTGIQRILDLGMAFEIDLRSDFENPMAALPSSVRYFRPANPTGIMSPYLYGLQNNSDQYRDVFKELARPENYPCIVHCRAGADRTGTVTALLEALLGCSYEQIARDFQWTSLSVYGVRDTTWQEWKDMIGDIRRRSGDSTLFSGTINYLLSIGVTPEECAAIRSILLEPGPMSKKTITNGTCPDIGPVHRNYLRSTPHKRQAISGIL